MTTPTGGQEGGKALDLDAAEKTVEIASKELGDLCKARWAGGEAWERAWHWEIPANEERDTDLRIGAAIGLAKDLIARVRELEAPRGPYIVAEGSLSEADLRLFREENKHLSDFKVSAPLSLEGAREALLEDALRSAWSGLETGFYTAETQRKIERALQSGHKEGEAGHG
jgi:hypothetical protein